MITLQTHLETSLSYQILSPNIYLQTQIQQHQYHYTTAPLLYIAPQLFQHYDMIATPWGTLIGVDKRPLWPLKVGERVTTTFSTKVSPTVKSIHLRAPTSVKYRSKPQHHLNPSWIPLQMICGPYGPLNWVSGGGKGIIVKCLFCVILGACGFRARERGYKYRILSISYTPFIIFLRSVRLQYLTSLTQNPESIQNGWKNESIIEGMNQSILFALCTSSHPLSLSIKLEYEQKNHWLMPKAGQTNCGVGCINNPIDS